MTYGRGLITVTALGNDRLDRHRYGVIECDGLADNLKTILVRSVQAREMTLN